MSMETTNNKKKLLINLSCAIIDIKGNLRATTYHDPL